MWGCRMGGESYNRRLVHSFVLIVITLYHFQKLIASVLKYEADLNMKFKYIRMHYYNYVL